MDSDEVRSHWNKKYQEGLPSLQAPDPFFLSAFGQFVADHFPNGGTALDLAGGVGRHALWLAQKNWNVTVVDISEVAIKALHQKARRLDLRLNLIAMEAKEYQFVPAQFDLIVLFYRFDRDIAPRILSSLRTGGFVICKSSVLSRPYEGTAAPSLWPLLDNEILTLLAGLRVLHHHERPIRARGVVEYVGRKNPTGPKETSGSPECTL